MRRWLLSSGFLVASLAAVSGARAQSETEVAPLQPASTVPMPVPQELLLAHQGGLTSEQVGKRALETSFDARQSLETLRAAQARMGAAWAAFLPRLSGSAKYTRLSNFTVPNINIGTATAPVILPGKDIYPLFLDNYALQATLTVPISDYFLRINQLYTSATKSTEAARFDLGATRASTLTNARVAYYTWMQMRGAIIVAVETLNDQRVHLNDSRNQFTVGNASKADVLRAETNVAAAELTVETSENSADLAETQMRIALHASPDRTLVPGEGLDGNPPPFSGNLKALVSEGLSERFEVKSVERNAEAARQTAAAQKAGRYPVVSAFGDAIYSDPNPRLFPAQAKFFPTWDLGVQAIWAPNDILTANGNAADYTARAAALEAQAQVTREGIEVEITTAWQAEKQAEFALGSTARELASAEEAYRVAHELFINGRGTSTTLTDAERDLASARIDSLNARVNARIAHVKLDHSVGRDLRNVVAQP